MAQKFDYPKSESEFRAIQDEMYAMSKKAIELKTRPIFKGLMEIIVSETVIITAIHNIKSNKGSKTPGTDGEIITKYLQNDYAQTIKMVRDYASNYEPVLIRREWIPKPGKEELRPLGIPAIIDRILQECIRLTIDPIMEAQFFEHSYGFRSMRSTEQALERLTSLVHQTGFHWVVEGDISKYFDTINHRRLLNRLWEMGIRDRRLLQIIKKMMEAGIMNEIRKNMEGVAQGGILSPLLANVYLDVFDQWIAYQWVDKPTKHSYSQQGNKLTALKQTKISPAYLIRYADDWVLVTKTKSEAQRWKKRIAQFLRDELKLTLSETKTAITNLRRQKAKFLGFEYKVVKGKSRKGYIPRTKPNHERLKMKVRELLRKTKLLKYQPTRGMLVHNINLLNSMIRGIINYYQAATWVNCELSKFAYQLNWTAYRSLKKYGGKWTPANQVDNLISVHKQYTTKIPAIRYQDRTIGITSLAFCKWVKTPFKTQQETLYTIIGRAIHLKRTAKKPLMVRADELLSISFSNLIAQETAGKLYNFEYFMNRAYAFNRDKGKCRVSERELLPHEVHIHRINPNLPINKVNKVSNMATVHKDFHYLIHSQSDYSHLSVKIRNKIQGFRDKLVMNTDS